jgi:hypothetical protein
MWNNKPLIEGKDAFIFHAEDFVSAYQSSEMGTPLVDFIHRYLDLNPESRFKVGT